MRPAQALHALCLTDVELCLPPDDRARFARALAPYLKARRPARVRSSLQGPQFDVAQHPIARLGHPDSPA